MLMNRFAAILGGLFMCSPANADTLCAIRDDLVAVLARDYSETLSGQGVTTDGRLAELFVADSGSFTLIITVPSGISCLFLAGEEWESVKKSASSLPDFSRSLY